MAQLDLTCPNGCAGGEFEALNAPLIVDRTGRYLRHRAEGTTYVCAVCQSVAVDLTSAAREMRRRGELMPDTLRCPACGLEMLPPDDDPFADLLECPACQTRFAVEEGMQALHGGGRAASDDGNGATPDDETET